MPLQLCTNEEIELFKTLLQTQGCLATKIFRRYNAKDPDFLIFASEWNLFYSNDIQNIYYKTPEHLKSYHNILDRKSVV